jgi:hypothetical protein
MGVPTLEGINVILHSELILAGCYKVRLPDAFGLFCMWIFFFLLLCHAVTQSGNFFLKSDWGSC